MNVLASNGVDNFIALTLKLKKGFYLFKSVSFSLFDNLRCYNLRNRCGSRSYESRGIVWYSSFRDNSVVGRLRSRSMRSRDNKIRVVCKLLYNENITLFLLRLSSFFESSNLFFVIHALSASFNIPKFSKTFKSMHEAF
jgi:hypothetical protein